MKNLFLFLIIFSGFTFESFSTSNDTTNNKKSGVVLGGSPAQINFVIDNIYNTKSNVEFELTNHGTLGYDQTNTSGFSRGGLKWQRRNKNYYLYGSGLWFGAIKNVNDSPTKLCVVSYNLNSGHSVFQPSVMTSTDTGSLQQTRIFRSTDFNSDGTSIQKGFAANWMIWDTDPLATLYTDGYIGNLVNDPEKRTKINYPKGAVFISDEDFVTVFDDQNLNRYYGEPVGQDKIDTLIKRGYPINIRVIQRVYTWSSNFLKDVVIVEQKIINTGSDTLYNCALAPVFDFDITYDNKINQGANDNFRYLKEDSSLKLSIMWTQTNSEEKGKGIGYMGIGFLRTPAIDNNGYLFPNKYKHDRSTQVGTKTIRISTIENDPFADSERYNFIAANFIDTTVAKPSDKRLIMSTSGINFRPHDTATIAYVLCFAKPSAKTEADGSWNDAQGVVNLFKKTRDFYDATFDKKTLSVENEPVLKEGIHIYPNPTNNRLFVQLPDEYREANVSLFTLLGNRVAKVEQGSNGVSIDVSMLSAGMYVVRVELQSGVNVTIPVAVIH